MTNAESKRLSLYNRLQEVLGTDPATTLMAYLSAIEAPDLLTKDEFRTEMNDFKSEVRRRFEQIDNRFKQTDNRFVQVNKRIDRVLLAVVGGMFVILAAIVGTIAF